MILYDFGDLKNFDAIGENFASYGATWPLLPPSRKRRPNWRQDVTTGNGRTSTYFDALWRPVYVNNSDLGDVANTSRITKTQYDFGGRPVFASYPQRDFASIAGGVYTEYEALGRTRSRASSSELGNLWESWWYNSGFAMDYVNPRGLVTTSTYQVFDEPPDKAILTAAAPEGVNLNIARDTFGKTKSVTRSGGGKSAARSYVYDANERLCKTIEPETGATVQFYDAGNNVAWRASGLALPSTSSCDTASVAAAKKVTYGYDTLNRLTSTTYGDASPSITRSYTPDGLPLTINSNGANWTYDYNKLRLNKLESLVYGGTTYAQNRSYDANGSLSQLTYPVTSLAVAYNPNALGEPRQVGSYASAVTYHPNGAIKSFTYGNGITHALSQNTRGLPARSTDSGILNDAYVYDQNGNVSNVADDQESVTNRAMQYDGLDRLKVVSAPNLWNNASYSYDALDNLTGSIILGGTTARSMTHNFPDPATNRLMSITGTAGYSFNYGYDTQGNITQRGAQAYVFDLANRMTQATGKATYGYDGWGRRVSVVGLDGLNRVNVYSQGGQLMYAGPTGAVGTKYIFLHNHVIAEVGPSGTQYDHTDGLGSPVARTTLTGALISRTRYEPYGYTATGAAPTIGFTGHMNDADTGLNYMQQRYYDPIAGRMLSIDPVTTDANTGGSFNRYAYANNSPYKYIDPDGHSPFSACAQCYRLAGPGQETIGDAVQALLRSDTFVKLTEPLVGPELAALSGGLKALSNLSKVETALSDATIVCRGGSCTQAAFEVGKGVTKDAVTSKLEGISTEAASSNIPHRKVGVSTVGDIKAAGGTIVNDRGNHATVSGVSAENAAELFKYVVKTLTHSQ